MVRPEDFYLPEPVIRDLFERRVKDFVFSGYRPQQTPVLALVGAQQGAGKSQAIAARQQEPGGRDLVPLSSDDLRPLHPRHAEVMATAPELMKDATAQATDVWKASCRTYAQEHRYSVMLEDTFRAPESLMETAREFAASGYQVEVTALSVREERSRLDTLNRYLPTYDEEPGRWVTPSRHDRAYQMIPHAVARAEEEPAVHRVRVTNRAGADLYNNHRTPAGDWANQTTGADAVRTERARPMSPEQAERWLRLSRQVTLNYLAAGRVNETSRDVLQRVLKDAETIGPMAPLASWGSAQRDRHAALSDLVEVHTHDAPWTVGASWQHARAYTLLSHGPDPETRPQLDALERRAERLLHPDVTEQRAAQNIAALAFPDSARPDRSRVAPETAPSQLPIHRAQQHELGPEL